MRSTLGGTLAVLALAGWTAGATAQSAFGPQSLVRAKCATCHEAAADARIPRVEDLRTTPEEWTVIVDRMRRLHGMPLRAGEMDRLLKELSATQILAPDEQRPVAYLSLWHNAQVVETPAGDAEAKAYAACVRCHTAGKILSYRMTGQAWAKLRDFHLYIVPTVVFQLREMRWVEEADAALAHFAGRLPYGKPWQAPAAKLAGDWAVFGYAAGRGPWRGAARLADAGDGEWRLDGALVHADGLRETFAGEATLYGGYALRTRTRNNGDDVRGAFVADAGRIDGEWHHPAPDFRTSQAQWLRLDGPPRVARVWPAFLVAGERTTLTVEGVNLPDAAPADVRFAGARVRVHTVKRIAPTALAIVATASAPDVATAALTVGGLDAGRVTLAPAIDHIAVVPPLGRARMSGGTHYPAEGVQFEAVAYAKPAARGAKPVALGPVPATFRLAEQKTRPGDDDMTWLGAIGANGHYVPMVDYAPNPRRTYGGENSGLVRVLARHQRGRRSYDAQGELVVTVPDYIARLR